MRRVLRVESTYEWEEGVASRRNGREGLPDGRKIGAPFFPSAMVEMEP
jgi:hypothetical protein